MSAFIATSYDHVISIIRYVIQTPLGGCRPRLQMTAPHLTQSRPPLAGYVIHKVA